MYKRNVENRFLLLGEKVFKRNKNWFRLMIIKSGFELYQECFKWLKTALLMAKVDGSELRSPSGLLTYKIR